MSDKKPEVEQVVAEEVALTVVEKQRFNKNRNVVKQDTETALSQRYGPHYIKTTFLIDRSNPCNQPSDKEFNLCAVFQEIAKRYASIDWQINQEAINSCSMTAEEKRLATARQPHALLSPSQRFVPAKPMQSRELLPEFDHVQVRRKKRVLVPVSGGISSLATLWWCLLQDFDVYLCYAFDSLSRHSASTENPFEIQCLLRLVQYARKKDGTMLFDSIKSASSNVVELTRAEIQQRVRVVQVPMSLYYLNKDQAIPPEMSNEQSLKAHPQSYLLFYRQMITVAQSLSCSSIALGMFGDARLLLDAANSFWKEIHEHDLLFPFESRKNALETFQEACEQSWLVWRSFLSKQEETVGVWQTAGPSILPNASHYVTTCVTRPPKPLEAQMLEAQERALERVQELIAVESQKEQDAIDDAIAKGEKMRKKRAVDPFQHAQYLSFFLQELESMKGGNESEQVLNFCGQSNCVDCAVWQCIARNWNTQTDSLRSKWQNLAGEYCARLKCNLERDKNVPMIVAKNLPKKRELAQNGEARPSKRPKSNDQDEDIDDKLHDDVDDEEKEEFDDEEDEEDADFEEEDEEEVIDEDAEEEDGQVILVEDEEIQDEDEEEEEAEEEEKEKDDEEDLDDDLEEEEEDDDDDEEEDDEDDADEDY